MKLSVAGLLACVTVSSASAQTTLSGFVRDSAGRPIPFAEVTIEALNRAATSNDAGHYQLANLAPGLRSFLVRRVGYDAVNRLVRIGVGPEQTVDFVLIRLARLDTVRAVGNGVRDRLIRDINERRAMGFGYFRDSTFLLRSPKIQSVFDDVPSIRTKDLYDGKTGQRKYRVFMRGYGPDGAYGDCWANVWIDGKEIRFMDLPDQDELLAISPQEIAVMEIYSRMSSTPVEFIQRGPNLTACGTIVIWTKSFLKRLQK